jgi:hypothetical protein
MTKTAFTAAQLAEFAAADLAAAVERAKKAAARNSTVHARGYLTAAEREEVAKVVEAIWHARH